MASLLFVQLPPPRFSFSHPPVNIPLAAGFMAASLIHSKANVAASILEESLSSVYADKGLLEAVIQQRPDVLALTLYVWNAQRSLFLASKVKEVLPQVKIVVGGPEVTHDNKWVLHHPAVDAGVFGEGESRIQPVLELLFANTSRWDIAGTFYKEKDSVRLCNGLPGPWDLHACPYPYLLGIIGPSRSGTLFLETVRGCPFRCRYCYYHKAFGSMRRHPLAAVEQVIHWAYQTDSQVTELYLMDPSFNVSPHYRDVLALMAKLRKHKDIRAHTELRADLLDKEAPKLLSEAGVASVEVGLQSVNPKALSFAGRTGSIERIARGVENLKKDSIDVTTGIILGLPGDSPEDFQKTLQWLQKTGAYSVVHPFLLSVLPGTDFRTRAPQLGLAFDERPPYYVQATPQFTEDELRHAMLSCESTFDIELDHIDLPSLVDHAPDLVMHAHSAPYISKWIADPSKKAWKANLENVLKKATDPFIIWFKGRNSCAAEDNMMRIVSAFFEVNPHAFVHIIFEYPAPPRPLFLRRLATNVAQPSTYVNKSMQSWVRGVSAVSPSFIILAHDPLENSARETLITEYQDLATVVWDIGVPDDEIICRAMTPCLVSAAVKPGTPYGYHLIYGLRKYLGNSPEEVLFRDRRLHEFWLRSNSLWSNQGFPERIVADID